MNPDPQDESASTDSRAGEVARRLLREPYVPASTYRIQLNRGATFAEVAGILDYFAELGVEALYFSPFFQAAPGSPHGYDMVDPGRLNAEIGTEEEYRRLCAGLAARGMGQIADVVPNHMGISGNANAWWLDVLENGPSSARAHVFDIDWESSKAELKDRVLLPVLGSLYGKVLEAGEISVEYHEGALRVRYWDHRFPADPKTYAAILGHRLPELEAVLGPESPALAEFHSVVTAFRNLPERSDARPGRAAERQREKEVAKKRLRELCASSPRVAEWVAGRLAELNGTGGQPASFGRLHAFLESQPYRLAYWQAASDEINYRRFFDINTLAAIRIEDERVFELHHGLLLRLLGEGLIQGLRIDHPDGLYDPARYFDRLQERCLRDRVLRELGSAAAGPAAAAAAARAVRQAVREAPPGRPPLYVVAEKILEPSEELPQDWSVAGTVGYGFLNALTGLFIDRQQEPEFDKVYQDYIGHPIAYDQLIYDKKKFFTLMNMASETAALGHRLDRISERDWSSRDLTRNHLTLAIRETLACFPVYRTYIHSGDGPVSERDQRYIRAAIGKARSKVPALRPEVFDFLERVLLLRPGTGTDAEGERLYRDFALRFQQLSGPIMAKGVEDTSFYVFNRLLSLNEVGGNPLRFGWKRGDFHAYLKARGERWPWAMLETSTHDTKRSEDVRMRLAVLSELPREWRARLEEWGEMNACHKTPINGTLEPRRNTEYFIYQTMLGAWPNSPLGPQEKAALLGRVWETVLKSSREAKIYTDWTNPDTAYEDALRRFVSALFSDEKFLSSFLPFQVKVAFFGMLNSASALTFKLAAPGVPDTYQGCELWDYSLVDPDNRRRVDFDLRSRHLRSLVEMEQGGGPTAAMARSLSSAWKDGRLKMHLLRQGLRLRRREKELFLEGEYLALETQGLRQRDVVAFMRRRGGRMALAAGGRFFAGVLGGKTEAREAAWRNTVVVLPDVPACAGPWRNVFTGEALVPVRSEGRLVLEVSSLFKDLSAALLVNGGG